MTEGFLPRLKLPADPAPGPATQPISEQRAANPATFVLMFIPYVSTGFVPARTMPGVLRAFAAHQPFTPIVETMRALWRGHTSTGAAVGHGAWIAIAYCTGILAVPVTTASWLFRHRTAA